MVPVLLFKELATGSTAGERRRTGRSGDWLRGGTFEACPGSLAAYDPDDARES
jgi:hypothetical protein